ncbi:MAG: MFS transporter [Candidatus Thorarchaeota archaeon]|nr:MFS transporter [Candidatus Thorarchaeota archaeon]
MKEVDSQNSPLYTNARVIVICLDAMLIMLGFGIIAPSMAFYLIALEGGLTQPPGPGYVVPGEVVAEFSVILGVMMAAFMGTRTLLARYWGGVSDTRGRRPVLITGLFGYVLLLILFGLAQDWVQLVLIRCLQGVVSAMVWPVAEAALMDIVGHRRRGEGMGLYMLISNVGFVVGPGLGGLLYNFCRDVLLLGVPDVFRVPYYIGALITLPAALMTIVVVKETSPGRSQTQAGAPSEASADAVRLSESSSVIDKAPAPDVRRMMRALYLMSAANGLAMGLGQPLLQLFLMSRISSDIGLIGLIVSGAGVTGLLFSIPAGRWSDRRGRKNLAVFGGLGARSSLAVLPLTTDLAQTSCVWVVQSAMMSVSEPALRAIQTDVVPWHLRGKLFGTLQAFFNAGATVGPLLGGALYSVFSLVVFAIGPFTLYGFVVPFWIAAILGLIAVSVLWRFVQETAPLAVVHETSEDTDSV